MYVYYGTNEYNFAKLENLPSYEPTRCSKCNSIIVLSEGGYSRMGDEYFCIRCSALDLHPSRRRTRRST
jgi:DNA-directed RNA polymerase subunit RPC12/RpoP